MDTGTDTGEGEPEAKKRSGATESTPETPAEPTSKATFEVFEDRGGRWRWRLVHDNGNVIAASGEGYATKAAARKGIGSVKANAAGAAVYETQRRRLE